MNDKSEYFDEYVTLVSAILVDFQFIEEGIRIYISCVFKYIETELSGIIPFRYDDKDIEKDSLGKLINKFEKVNDNNDLIAEMKELKKYRNDCAHRGFLLKNEQAYDEKYNKYSKDTITQNIVSQMSAGSKILAFSTELEQAIENMTSLEDYSMCYIEKIFQTQYNERNVLDSILTSIWMESNALFGLNVFTSESMKRAKYIDSQAFLDS